MLFVFTLPLMADDPPPKPPKPPAPEPVSAADLEASIQRGVGWLLAHQRPDGAFGGPERTKDLNITASPPGAHHDFRERFEPPEHRLFWLAGHLREGASKEDRPEDDLQHFVLDGGGEDAVRHNVFEEFVEGLRLG